MRSLSKARVFVMAGLLGALQISFLRGQEDKAPDAVCVFQCTFDDRWDNNYDHWPDLWNRQKGPNHPHYVKISIEDDPTADANRALKIHLNGGEAMLSSPDILVNYLFSYQITARVKAEGLKRDKAVIEVHFFDDQDQLLLEKTSEKFSLTNGWKDIDINSVVISDPTITKAVINLRILTGDRPDLSGIVSFDAIKVMRMPRIIVKTPSQFNVFSDPDQVMIECEISGIQERDPTILFELLDDSSQVTERTSESIQGRLIEQKSTSVSQLLGVDEKIPPGYVGNAKWKPSLKKTDYGYYSVRVTMLDSEGQPMMHENVSLAIVQPLPESSHGIFGWSLADGDRPMSMETLAKFLPQVGIHWVKVPVWYHEKDDEYGNRVLRLAEQLATSGIDLIGVIDGPPENSEFAKQLDSNTMISDILSMESSNWLPLLDPIMTRLSLRVRWWQLGSDYDTSYGGYPGVDKKINQVRSQLYRFGQDVNLGICWKWIEEASDTKSLQFLQYSADPALTGEELKEYLEDTKGTDRSRWVLIQPLRASKYSLETRAHDLVAQMMSAKINHADAAFVPNPFDSDQGLMKQDGTPGELLLPWRTTAVLLGGTTHIGDIVLKNGSENRIFRHEDGTTVMVIWNDQPMTEQIFLGDSVRQFDIWGRETPVLEEDGEQIIRVSSMPVFLVGIDEHVAKWRIATKVHTLQIPSIFSMEHLNHLTIKSDFPQGVGGWITMDCEDGWKFRPQRIPFKIGTNEELKIPFRIELPPDSSSGPRQVRIDFEFTSNKQYKFSVYRTLEVGLGDIRVDVHTHFEGDTLIIEQHIHNNSIEYLNFRSLLYAKGERRQERTVFRLGSGVDVQQFRYPNGRNLVGEKLWLNIKEMGGERVLNHRFVVEE